MTYYPDLTAYEYGDATGEGERDLVVGWLSAEHPFPTASASREFVAALVRCALRPVRLYRGAHTCDICPEEAQYFGETPVRDGHIEASVGNGEIRVRDASQWYTAPTMVAHYVVEHGYAPPLPFVRGVLDAAREIIVLAPPDVERLRSLSIAERYDVCLAIVERIREAFPAIPWLGASQNVFIDLVPLVRSGEREPHIAALRAMDHVVLDQVDEVPGLPPAHRENLRRLTQFFRLAQGPGADDQTLLLTSRMIEAIRESGLSFEN